MKTLVLNLDNAAERRKYMNTILLKEGIEFEFLRSFSPGDFDPGFILENSSAVFSKEGVAAFETHRRAIGMAKELDEFVMILEDDATPTINNVRSEIDKLLGKTSDFDIMFLGYFLEGLCQGYILYENFVKIKNFFGFHAYVVNPNSVDKILGLLESPNCHIDVKVSRLIQEGKINALFVKRRLFTQNNRLFKTQIPKKKDILNPILYDARQSGKK
jgi:hypothetical protein